MAVSQRHLLFISLFVSVEQFININKKWDIKYLCFFFSFLVSNFDKKDNSSKVLASEKTAISRSNMLLIDHAVKLHVLDFLGKKWRGDNSKETENRGNNLLEYRNSVVKSC